MDEYDKKFAEMQKYIPFLEAMIERLQNVKDKSREVQLQKMQSLHGILSNSKRKLKIETLQRCEDVLQKLHNKVEKFQGNTPGLHFPKRNDTGSAQSSSMSDGSKIPHAMEHAIEDHDIHETPASPSPPVSPDSGSQVEPIIIPTERSVDFDHNSDSKPASPDPIDTLPTKAPIIIPTERTSNDISLSPTSQRSASKSTTDVSFVEWDMLQENENQMSRGKSWQTIVTSSHDSTPMAKMIGSNLSQKVNDGRGHPCSIPMHCPRQMSTLPPVASSMGCSRRLPPILDKNRTMGVNLDQLGSDSRPESPANVAEARLKSPDSDILYAKHGKITSPRLKDSGSRSCSKPSAPLLLSPPPVSTEPPLSMEDLAELLNEDSENKAEKKGDRLRDESAKFKKEKQELNKDLKVAKSFLLSQEDIDMESERRWEEVDKHIVKLTSRKCLPSGSTATLTQKMDTSKSSETKGPLQCSLGHGSNFFSSSSSVSDNRNRPPSPGSKAEPRFADNYERHPRQLRENHGHDKDKTNMHHIHCRSDEDMPNQIPMHHASHQRRQGGAGPDMMPPRPDPEFRMEGPEYFNRQVSQNQGHWAPMHGSSVNTKDFCNNQWPPASNFSGMPNSPAQSYQHPMGMHQEMWNVGSNREPIHMDPHQMNEGQHRPNQFPSNMNTGIRPLMSPNTRPQDMNHIPRTDEISNVDVPNVPTIQPLISPTRFPVGPPQYRSFQGENRPYDSFDRGMEYSHQRQSWDSPANRSNDGPYRPENEVPCGVLGAAEGPSGSYPRPSTPCPWNRDRDRNVGRGRGTYYNDRNRGEPRGNFNRDARRPEWPRDSHNEWDNCNRFSRDARNISDRDPRVRIEHNLINQSPGQARDNGASMRDPRLAKDKHFPTAKCKDPSFNERDPRKRTSGPLFTVSQSFRKIKEKPKSPSKPVDSHRRMDTDSNSKQAQEKLAKDKMQSPLESLYGVIDTKAKSAQGYCLQNFKIPKIKRTESSESPSSSHISEEPKECSAEPKQEPKDNKKEKEDAMAEVSSSSDGNVENWNDDSSAPCEKKEEVKEENTSVESVEDKIDVNVLESDSISTTSKLAGNVETSKKDEIEAEGSKPKDEVTQEWIEALIRKSFEFGEGKKFVEQAKFMQKLGEVLQAKKLKKIKKIIESESESSSSDKDDTVETRKVQIRKKRRVIVSDSSDEECLAERLGILNTTKKESCQDVSPDDQKVEASKTIEEEIVKIESSDPQEKGLNQREETSNSQEDLALPETQSSSSKEEQSSSNKINLQKEESVAEHSKEESKQGSMDDKEVISKTPKAKAKRRNSLEMLQEDIREMFISDDVVAATGHRQCRTQKDSQSNNGTSAVNQTTPTTKKDEPSKREVDVDMDADAEDSSVVSSKQKKSVKPRNSEEFVKLRGRGRRDVQRVTRLRSRRSNQSSDSEEDQPLALRTELAQSSLSTQEPSNEDSDVLRRSKRIFKRESIKEPRVVVEKTDITKLDCTKIMFDSSSDESFGIDVSELAAAVDISLHPDKQAEPEAAEAAETAEPAEKKKGSQVSSKKSTKKKGGELTNEPKEDQLTDEESITSDISISSSIISAKKTGSNSTGIENSGNEELLSNILVGLVQSRNDTDKDSSIADKGSDADVDEDASDQTNSETNAKKCSAKKKKKKWQMGILSKKKRKKALASPSKGDTDALNTSSEIETSTKTSNSFTSEDTNQSVATEKSENDVKDNLTPDITLKDQQVEESTDVAKVSSNDFVTEKSSEVKDEKPKEKSIANPEKSANKNKEEVDKAFYDLDIKQLIDYAWTGQERYKCLLCFFTGKSIVHHYKLSHPGKEILISRLKASDAQLAVKDAKHKDVENTSSKPLTEGICEFHCRFCTFFTEGDTKIAMEAFYEHCTTHTGEYRFRCNSCPYQAVAKSSMRTHYYKVCRKFKETFVDAITEDEIPEESGIYGFMCSNCNYVQLKKNNVEDHVQLWHEDDSSVKIIKINMSSDPVEEESEEEFTVPQDKVEPEVVELNGAKKDLPNDKVSSAEEDKDDLTEVEVIQNSKTLNNDEEETKEKVIEVQPQKEDSLEAETDNNEEKKSAEVDTDPTLPSGNLSVFVCPPELEKKEVEIQLERKRKMQEIIQNIGIKLQKDASKKGLSIIDKLKDKMKTDVASTSNKTNPNTVSNSTIEAENSAANDSPILLPSEVNITEVPSTSVDSFVENSETDPLLLQAPEDKNNGEPVSKILPSTIESDSQGTTEESNVDSNVKDPLAILDNTKNNESDAEASENENANNTAPIYDSDSSSEQSDGELPTDVNMILKETSNINASSKDPMLTTIQRLAAQLQATKPLETCSDVSIKPEKSKKASSTSTIPKPPDVVPIASIKKFIGKMENRFHEISQEPRDDSNQPKNFIRLRRLSGDMLSVPVQTLSVKEEILPSKNSASQLSSSDKMDSVVKIDEEEECSFLKIESVVSLAPSADNDGTESPIINDIRKAVEISPIKSRGVSVLKKSNSPLILRRLKAVTLTQPTVKNVHTVQSATETVKLIPVKNLTTAPVPTTTTQLPTSFIPIAPKSKIIQVDNKLSFPPSTNKSIVVAPVNTRTVTVTASSQPANLNYKILKVVRTPTLLKPKEPVNSSTAIKLKSADAYNAMLKAPKLIHLYKCMACECRFTTDVLSHYHQHYLQHKSEAEKKELKPPFDYQKCAYCYMILDDWNQMKLHIEEKHAHCRYQCTCCFYRAVAPSYVQIHQNINHPGHHGILLGKLVKDVPAKEDVNRYDSIYPYICQHDCGKFFYVPESFIVHLKSKHGSLLPTYKCHVCRTTCAKVEQLLTHYKIHGFHKYQCMYCLHGGDTFGDMHNHLSMFHCNRLPQILERTLPTQPVRNKDVIDQLIIRTLDDTFKTAEEIIDLENERKNKEIIIDIIAASATKKIRIPQLPTDVTMLKKDDSESDKSTLSSDNTSKILLNATLLQSDKLLNESSNDGAASKLFGGSKDSDVSVTSIPSKESADKKLSDKPKQANTCADKKSIDSLEPFEGTFDCSDEFININILDNPDFLKKASKRTSDISTAKNSTTKENKTEDSDIEIVDIDDTDIIPTKNIKSEVNKRDSNDGNEKKLDEEASNKSNQPSNDDENSSASTDSKKTFDGSTKIDKPMTLEDIKDTGFSGTKLYKCGNEKCDFRAQNAVLLRIHLKDCTLRGTDTHFNCAHCSKRFMKIGFLLEHLKSHGLKRFGCSMCKMRCTVGYQAMAHMKAKHRYAYSKLVPADPTNPSVDGLFIVQPVRQNSDKKGKKRKSSTKSSDKESDKIDSEKFSFSPEEIDSLPRQAIYNREVQCAVCPYTTKVRMNIIRHLQMHAKDESVPESGPVNPVPCLDKKERMFDKMVNLASSSHQNGRMGGKLKESIKDNDDEFIPKFVPEHKRYVCGVAECNYLTVDEAMLRCHLKALHSEEQYFRCPHCPQPTPGQEGLNIAIDKMGVHLKMHDTRLYKCSHCNHHHYHRHVVERHLSDKHPEKRPFVKVIRELESTENNQQPVQEEIEEEIPDPDGNHWKCNICDYKCVYKAEMVNHTTVTHDEKCQYKCTSCSFKTSGKIMFEQHLNSKHPNDLNVDYILIYQRIKGVNKKSTETIEQTGQEEPFDTTPLWRRDMPRIRHIRGILLEEEDNASTDSSLKTGKRKSDAELQTPKPAKIKAGKSLDDSKQTKEKSKRSLSCDKVATEVVEPVNDTAPSTESKPKEMKAKPVEDNDFNEPDVGRFGPYGKSDGNMYVCTLCTQFKTKYKHDMRDHLYRELNYARWHCKECGYLSVNRNGLLKHFNKHHNGERPNHEPLSPDNDIEEWVGTLLKRQTLMIKGLLAKQNTNNTENSTAISSATSDNKSPPIKATQSTLNKTPKPVNIADKPSTAKDAPNTIENIEIDVESQDEGNKNKEKEQPVANAKDDDSKKEKSEKNTDTGKAGPEEEQEKPFVCKHCKMTFTRWRGFKLHIQLTHLKRLGFICPYCDRSTNSESLMRQHIRSKHPGCPEQIVENPAAGGPELPEEFWQQEYGIVFPKRTRKRKRKLSGEETSEKDSSNLSQIEPQEKCNKCNFTAMNTTGLKIHMRIHASKTAFKCAHCSFTAPTNTEVWEHWELTHPLSPFKVEEVPVPESSVESTDSQMEEKQDKIIVDDYSNDIEEEHVTEVREKESIYYCFYCSFRSKSLDAVQSHWSTVHNEQSSQDDSGKGKLNIPFKYKEVQVSPEKSLLKPQCSTTQTESSYELYLQQSHGNVQELETVGLKLEGWICQWCNELCDSEVKMKTHHSMFHSHLPLNFKKEDKNKMSRGYVCPDCSFTTTFINVMKSHVSKHINIFKCKYCEKTFSCPAHVSSHNLEEHPDMELKIESIQNYEALQEKIMAKVKWQKSRESSDTSDALTETPIKINAVAKKSTSRNSFRPNVIPYRVKAVARKSTNPLSRYLTSNKPNDRQATTNKEYSYYGVPRSPVNLAKLNTYMVVGGHRMKVNCTTLAQLININPTIVLKDLKHDVKHTAMFKKLK